MNGIVLLFARPNRVLNFSTVSYYCTPLPTRTALRRWTPSTSRPQMARAPPPAHAKSRFKRPAEHEQPPIRSSDSRTAVARTAVVTISDPAAWFVPVPETTERPTHDQPGHKKEADDDGDDDDSGPHETTSRSVCQARSTASSTAVAPVRQRSPGFTVPPLRPLPRPPPLRHNSGRTRTVTTMRKINPPDMSTTPCAGDAPRRCSDLSR
jgi:hypothetical protein